MGKLFKGSPPFQTCPKCGCAKFGVLSVHQQSYTRRCNDCDFDQAFRLPKPRKKIIYLDQFAISLLVKVRMGRAPKAELWQRLRDAIDRAIQTQAIICPYSELHERESWFAKGIEKELFEFYNRISLGRSYRSSFEIQSAQIYDAVRIFEEDSPASRWPRWSYVLREDPNIWHDLIFIKATIDKTASKAAAKIAKDGISARVQGLTEYFQASKKTFDEQYRLELHQQSKNVVQIWSQEMRKLAACQTPEQWADTFMHGSVYSDTMRQLMRYFGAKGYSGELMLKRIWEFLRSPTFEVIDTIRLTAALWAGIARKVNLKEAIVRPSDYNDVELISHYAPYCDAMLIDRRMKDLLVTNPVKEKVELETKFFSAGDLESFIAYIDRLVEQVSEEVQVKVLEVYGPPRAAPR